MAGNNPITIARRVAHRGLPLEQRMLAYRVHGDGGCWNWTGDTNGPMGYGRITIGSRTNGSNKTVQVHRLAASLWLGFDMSSELKVCHHCDNPICFNPSHLFIGTALDNNRDCIAKGRKTVTRGESNGSSKLTDDKVRKLRALKAETAVSDELLAVKFGICQTMVSRILKRKAWTHV